MRRYRRKRKSKAPAVFAALILIAVLTAAILILPNLLSEGEEKVSILPNETPEAEPVPEQTPDPTPMPTERPVYIPDVDELHAIPAFEAISFSGGFASAVLDEQGALSLEWPLSDQVDYYVLCVLDMNNAITRTEIFWADIARWQIGRYDGSAVMLLGYKDMGEDMMDDDVVAAAYYEHIEPLDLEPSPEKDYYIIVDKEDCTFAVYQYDERDGDYTRLVDQFPCALGGAATPSGTFAVGEKGEWKKWTDEQFSPYFIRYARSGGRNLYFHGPVYTDRGKFNTLVGGSYDGIGRSNVTHGCIRTTVEGAKFIYDYCKPGTVVEIVKSSDRVTKVTRPDRDKKYARWDPTDPNKPVAEE